MVLTFCLLLAAATANQREELSLMGPKDVAYTEAMQFAESLQRHGIAVQSIHRSKMEGFFKGLNKAAFIRTDKGVVEVIFFDDPAGAEKVLVLEQRQGERYIYAFQGQPQPQSRERIEAGYPIYFVSYKNWFMVVMDKELATALQQAFVR